MVAVSWRGCLGSINLGLLAQSSNSIPRSTYRVVRSTVYAILHGGNSTSTSRGKVYNPDLLLLDARLLGLINMLPLCPISKYTRRIRSVVLTMDWMLVNSLSAVTATDCTRNLSLHLISKGGSCFMAWRRTAGKSSALKQFLENWLVRESTYR